MSDEAERMRELVKNKRLITWKDADQNLCTLAAYMLHEAAATIRTDAKQTAPKPTQDPEQVIEPGFADETIPEIGYWTRGWTEAGCNNPVEVYGYDSVTRPVSALCWYAFQNLVRIRLRQARRELKLNLYGTDRKLSYQKKNVTRNATGRRKWFSKFGRTKERS